MRWKTARRRKVRKIEKYVLRRIHLVFNRGPYMSLDCGEHGIISVPLNTDIEQPRAYRKYP